MGRRTRFRTGCPPAGNYNIKGYMLTGGGRQCYIVFMEEDDKKRNPGIWLYLIPLFILAAWPALKWLHKANSSELNLSKDDYTAFNSDYGEIRKGRAPQAGNPQFDDSVLGVRYKSKGGAAENETRDNNRAARPAAAGNREPAGRQNAAASPAGTGRNGTAVGVVDATKTKEQRSAGSTRGYLTYAVGKAMNNPNAVGAIFNNKYIVNGFMSRNTVKAATASPEGLANYLKGRGPTNFINNSIVKAAMNNPAIVNAVASSGLVNAMLSTPAVKGLMSDQKALDDIVSANPQLITTLMSNPNVMNSLMNNPGTSGLVGRISGVQKKR